MASWTRIIQPAYPRHDFSDRLKAKYFKLQPDRLAEVKPYEFIGWMDARITMKNTAFLRAAVRKLRRLEPHRRCMIYAHPWRKTVEEECATILKGIAEGNERLVRKFSGEPLQQQVDDNRAAGFDMSARLLAGSFWIRENSPMMNAAWDEWWDQNLRYSISDQLSLPLVLARAGIIPTIIPGDVYKNDDLSYIKHVRVM